MLKRFKKTQIQFDIITIFPAMFSYFNEGILGRAQKEKIISIQTHDLREYTQDKHKKVDDTPYGGGSGMIMTIQPFYSAISKIKKISKKTRVVLLSAKGKLFTHHDAKRLSKYKQVILLCGRYEGVDERVAKHLADEEISIGQYVLSGGEIPAMALVDSISRLIPGVLGEAESLTEESYTDNYLEYPHYTKPEHFSPKKGVEWSTPPVLLSGNHKKIADWKNKHKKAL